jgi:Flp pilus assembly protein TadD
MKPDPLKSWRIVAVVSCALGMACKESMVTAPLIVALFDRAFLFDSFAAAWRARRGLYIGMAATWLLLAALIATGPRVHSAGFSSGMSPWTYLLNQPEMIAQYLRLAVWPDSLVLLYGPPQPRTWVDAAPSGLFVLSLIGLTAVAWRRWPAIGFLGAWFWITLAPTSSIVPIATEVGAERRMYLPLMALVPLVVLAAVRLYDSAKRLLPPTLAHGRVLPVSIVLVLTSVSGALASVTVARNRDYASPVVMARTILDRYPTPFAHLMLARALLGAGEHGEAMSHLERALPEPGARFTLGMELIREGQLDAGVATLRAFVAGQRPFLEDVIVARMAMGNVLMDQERWMQAEREFRLILESVPGNPAAEHQLAEALFAQNLWEEAIVHYRAYFPHNPNDSGALNNFGIALASSGRIDEARTAFHRAIQIDPANGPAEGNLARLLLGDQQFEEALAHAQRAAALQPGDPGSHELLGRIWLVFDRLDDAERQFRRVLELDPSSAFAKLEIQQLEQIRRRKP